ncbi:hypothetical protein IHQ56_03705 [Methylobacillus flagellatus]|uniref:hypothetical protein n=1 Tax=Methylobacillus flagellatus TaxID=405 RepID=UPI002853B114|nr:hypothetical protein [Methylobacillus flagellatus]MDR5170918.1 hypothetical protein [Methylobacillus flagellatus]
MKPDVMNKPAMAAVAGLFSMLSHANDAALSSEQPAIPEPMLFDLVRPLGSPKGELEVNNLAEHSLRNGDIQWAPEIEYAFADGYALEIELPFENSSLSTYKLALQGTLDSPASERMIHGWQVIAKRKAHENTYSADALYLHGYRMSPKWSTFNMLGVRRTELGSDGRNVVLSNNSLFYSYSSRLVLGLEVNNEIDHRMKWRYRITPQLHYNFDKHRTLQFGIGPSRLGDDMKTEWLASWRLIYAF